MTIDTIANTITAVIAVLAAIVAIKQLKEAKDARTVTIYNEINSIYNSDATKSSLRHLHNLEQKYSDDKSDELLGTHVDGFLQEQRKVPESSYTETIYYLTFLEYISVIVRKKLVDKSIIFDFMGGTILVADRCLREHMKRSIKEENDNALFANARWLMDTLKEDLKSDKIIFRYT